MTDEFAKINLATSRDNADNYSRLGINAQRDIIRPIPAFEDAGLYLERKE